MVDGKQIDLFVQKHGLVHCYHKNQLFGSMVAESMDVKAAKPHERLNEKLNIIASVAIGKEVSISFKSLTVFDDKQQLECSCIDKTKDTESEQTLSIILKPGKLL